jgi:Putative DnaT-like ssDNA binding protein
MIVEDGTGLSTANSYVSEDDADTYFDAKGNTDWTDSSDDKEAALVRATQAIDATYRMRFPGYKTELRNQALEWPRTSAYDAQNNIVEGVPVEIIQATCEAALRELTDPNSMRPDLSRGGDVRRLQAGSVSIEYGAGSSTVTTYTLIDGILSGLLGPKSIFNAVAVRG